MHRSGEKTISPTYTKFISIISENPDIEKTPEELMGKLIRGKFNDKWNRVYNALISEQYNPLNNYDVTEHKTGNNQNTDTYNTTKGTKGKNTDTTTYDTNVEDNGNTGTHETITRNINEDNSVYGYNSNVAVDDNKSVETTNETTVGDKEKNTSHNIQIKTGTESKVYDVSEDVTHTGTDTEDISIDETLNKTGRDNSGASLIEEELNLRNKQIFFDIIYSDIDSITTLSIYI